MKFPKAILLAASPGTGIKIINPIGFETLDDVFAKLSGLVLPIAIPVATLMIIWAGFKYLTAAGNANQIKEGNDILKWTVIGLAIIFVGGGFVTLIKSILSAGQ